MNHKWQQQKLAECAGPGTSQPCFTGHKANKDQLATAYKPSSPFYAQTLVG